jgi:hypothetical protein
VAKKQTECIGQTYADLQAMAIVLAATMGITEAVDTDEVVRRLIAEGWAKPCSVHPDHYLLNRKRRQGPAQRGTVGDR